MHWIQQVQYLHDYILLLTFEDGRVKQVNLAGHLDGDIFAPLRNQAYFKTVQVNTDLDTIVWDNGADISPDFLYEIGEEIISGGAAAK